MKISALLAILCCCGVSCEIAGNPDGGEPGGEVPGVTGEYTFPELDSFMPEEDVPSQGKSRKRGICTNFRIANMPEFLGHGVSWCYNWAHNPLDGERWAMLRNNGMYCLPMVWNAGFSADNFATFPAADSRADYVLAYNEPNLTDQANMTPEQAAAVWPDFVAAAKAKGLKIVGPAVNYGTLAGYGDPVKWYDDFLAQPGVSIDDIDAIALHTYMPNGNAVKTLMVRKFYKYNKPLWMTEYANGEARDVSSQQSFCQEATIYLEADPRIERYAWFMDTIGQNNSAPHFPMIATNGPTDNPVYLTDLGKIYTGLSTLDKDHWYRTDVNIPAEHYTGQIIEETAGQEQWGPYVSTGLTNDLYGNLEITNLAGDKWVEYNVDIPRTGVYRIDLRYLANVESTVKIDCDGSISAIAALPKTTTNENQYLYRTEGVEMELKQGRNTVRLTIPIGSISLNWLRFTSPEEFKK